ncbi:MAG: 50S ribosomal protein L35 [Dehalococcoidia bacterium]|nr:50S ribosomal protein L35 [Dehalococcoidia bacterium]
MPKMKTHKGTAKRVHLTGTGKVMIRNTNPKRAKRSRTKMTGLGRDVVVGGGQAAVIKANLPYA